MVTLVSSVVIFLIGLSVAYSEYRLYTKVTFESVSKPRSISMTEFYGTKLESMTVFISDTVGRIDSTEGWRATNMDIVSSSPKINFMLKIPHEIAHFKPLNLGGILAPDIPHYEKDSDQTTIKINYETEGNRSRVLLLFDWRIAEKFSSDQERIVLGFGTPFVGAEIGESREFVEDVGVLHVDKLVVEIDEKKQLDYSRTVPPPTFLKTTERSVNPVWSFGQHGPISAIQAVFTDESLRKRKIIHTFLSGVLVALDLTILLEPILETIRRLANW